MDLNGSMVFRRGRRTNGSRSSSITRPVSSFLTILSINLVPDMTDKAVSYIRAQKATAPDKPFFVYFAPGATHAPHHVPKEWADKYKGKFDDGWDKQRERTFAKQKQLGVIPADAKLTVRHKEIPAWDAMPENLKPVLRARNGSVRRFHGVCRLPCRQIN